ncbi:MAG: uncharacterized membrane-anchored protein YhcB (DUF1043 family) [Flavobacteriales bacterium]|jgi:uncharacterized membrane-anchored protein YhcB (DUF1043 family)
MDWLVGILLLLIGAVVGFFVAKFFSKAKHHPSDKNASEQTIQELMNQQAVMHVQETKQIVENITTQSAALKQQIENYEQLLINQQAGPEDGSLNYFGEHTTAYLRNKNDKPPRAKSTADVQPLDFSSHSSGLFSGNGEHPAKDTK